MPRVQVCEGRVYPRPQADARPERRKREDEKRTRRQRLTARSRTERLLGVGLFFDSIGSAEEIVCFRVVHFGPARIAAECFGLSPLRFIEQFDQANGLS